LAFSSSFVQEPCSLASSFLYCKNKWKSSRATRCSNHDTSLWMPDSCDRRVRDWSRSQTKLRQEGSLMELKKSQRQEIAKKEETGKRVHGIQITCNEVWISSLKIVIQLPKRYEGGKSREKSLLLQRKWCLLLNSPT
jgi:hypothetical protein